MKLSLVEDMVFIFPVLGGPSDGQYSHLDPRVFGGSWILVKSKIDGLVHRYSPDGRRWRYSGPDEPQP